MCGICGFASMHEIDGASERLQRMTASMAHRGPDAEGMTLSEGRLGLGHRRLAIIDLDSRSNQPMASPSGNQIVFNGEIYNYKDMASKLAYPFVTESDTEVLLASLEERGIDWTLGQCNGMFSFAWLHKAKGELILARDRMGIKPLYYYQDGKKIVFGSEIKAILESGLVEAVFNEDAVDEYLANRYVRAPYTFFKDIYQVEPGHYLRVGQDFLIQDVCYWNLPDEFNMDLEYDEDKIGNEFEHQVVSAIQRRMVSDVPLGTYLSGGVDSSIITAVAAQFHPDRLNTYTIGFDELNEFEYAESVARKYDTSHHEIHMGHDDYFSMMGEVIRYKDSPLGVPNEIPLAVMSRELKKTITVVLSGEGADELMGGYGRIFRSPYDYVATGKGAEKPFYEYFIEKYEYVPRRLRDLYLTGKPKYRSLYDEMIREDFEKRGNEENVFRFFHKYHVKALLQRVDATTMLAGVEARVPFLDHKLIEYAYKEIPYELKLAWRHKDHARRTKGMEASQYSEIEDTPKYLLRKIAGKYIPAEIIERKKVGFPVPLDNWIGELCTRARDYLKEAGWLRTDILWQLLRDCQAGSRAGQVVWMFINIEMFRKEYFTREWRYDTQMVGGV